MAITLAGAARNAACNAVVDLLDVGGPGNLQIATSAFALILSTLTLPNPAFGNASSGIATLLGVPLQVAAAAGGTAAVWRMRSSAGTAILSGFVNTTDNGADLTLDVSAQNAAINAIVALIGASGDIQLTTLADTGFATPLVTINLASTPFSAASGGSASITGTPSANATLAGTAGLFRVRDSSDVELFRGTVGISGADMNLPNNIFGVGTTVTVNTFVFQLPATSASSSGVLVFPTGIVFTLGETLEVSSYTYNQPA